MDEYSSRRSSGGLILSRRPSFLRDSAENTRDRNNVQVCSRAGCSSRLNQLKDTQIASPSKAKTPRTPFRSSNGKEIVGSSSKPPTSLLNSRKSFSGSKKKISFTLENDSETSSSRDDSEEASDSTPKSGKTQIRVHPKPNSETTLGPTNKPVKRKTQRLGVGKQDSSGAGVSGEFPFKQTNQGPKNGANTSRYNLRNLRCNSISDVVPSGSGSLPESSLGRKSDIGRKRIGEPESSLTGRGKKINGPALVDRRNENINRGISISDSRPTRNSSISGGNNDVRNRRSMGKTRVSNQDNRNMLSSQVESSHLIPSSPEPDRSEETNARSSDGQISTQTLRFSRPGSSSSSSNEHLRSNRLNGPYEGGISCSFMNRDALRHYGIAEMLLALDRIEQDEEPSYEQLLVLETNLFLGGLGLHDQHRDMRLDIDNMSYEELLALGDRMGTVSTAVPEEDLPKCLKKSIFQGTTDFKEVEDDFKCTICQEEYAEGEEVGRLECDHRYHVDCVNQWLRLKNWCPICKSSVSPSSSSSPA